MKKAKRIKLSKKSLITRIVIYTGISLLGVISYGLCPKTILDEDRLYTKYVELADVDDKQDIAMKEYFVYPTQKKFDNAFDEVVETAKKQCREANEILVVKIPGEYQIIRYEDYILIYDNEVPNLNIELCIAKNIRYQDSSFPVATFASAVNGISKKVNYIYIPLLIVVHLALILPFAINDILYINELISRRKQDNFKN